MPKVMPAQRLQLCPLDGLLEGGRVAVIDGAPSYWDTAEVIKKVSRVRCAVACGR